LENALNGVIVIERVDRLVAVVRRTPLAAPPTSYYTPPKIGIPIATWNRKPSPAGDDSRRPATEQVP
jgi:hypothetical protein